MLSASVAILAQELSLLEARSFPQAHHTRHKDQNRRTMVARAVVQLVLVLAVCQAMKPRMMREDNTRASTEIGATGTFRRVRNWFRSFVPNTGTSGEDTRMDTKDAKENDRKGTEATINDNGHTSLVENNGPNDDDTKENEYDQQSDDTKEYDTKVGAKENDRPNDDDTKENEYDQQTDDTKEYHTKVGAKENDRTNGAAGSTEAVDQCNVGDHVQCPGSTTRCAGDQCCPQPAGSTTGTITCPSASVAQGDHSVRGDRAPRPG